MAPSPSPGPPPPPAAKANTLLIFVLRMLFVLALGAVGWSLAAELTSPELTDPGQLSQHGELIMGVFAVAAIIVIALDVFFVPRKSLAAISAVFFGLIVGMVVAFGFWLIIDMVAGANFPGDLAPIQPVVTAVKLGIGVICCYLAVSFVLQTKDDIRFVIPYVEFAKEMKGSRPMVLDTSVIIDGRIADIAGTRIITAELIVPRFVLHELQTIADSSDKLKRSRGRRGLDMLNKLQANDAVDIRILDVTPERSAADAGVDEMLVDLGLQLGGAVATNDYNLNKIAQLRGVPVININDLANALKPVVLPGEALEVKIIKSGEEAGQGVGYLDDGTMIVAEGARDRVGEVIAISVTSVLQTSAGRMIFGRLEGAAAERRRQPKPERAQGS